MIKIGERIAWVTENEETLLVDYKTMKALVLDEKQAKSTRIPYLITNLIAPFL